MSLTRLNRREALTLYKEKTGRELSYHGLFHLANRFNFIEKNEDGFHYWYLKEKMEVYIDQILKPAPSGFFTIKQLAEKYGLSYAGIYYTINLHNLGFFEFGCKRIKMYSEEDFRKVYKKCKG